WDSTTRVIKRGEYEAAVKGAFDRLLKLAGNSCSRWASLIKAIPHLGTRELDLLVQGLTELQDLAEKDKAGIAAALREVVSDHRNFPSAQWAMAKGPTDTLDELRLRFEPTDLIAKHRWLFSWHARLPNPKAARFDDYEAYSREMSEARTT